MAHLPRRFLTRHSAGVELARVVQRLTLQPPLLVLGLPRGGVPVAYEVARALRAPLDVVVVRKIAMPNQPELAIGAIATGGILVRQPDDATTLVDDVTFEQLARHERIELERRERAYRAGLPPLDLTNATIILVDDGIATGCTMIAAVRAARKAGAARVVVATPVASDEAAALVAGEADNCIILQIPIHLSAIAEWYQEFEQVEDREVCNLLTRASNHTPLRA
jgi:putative phosphoribosyl transferase